MKTQIDNSTGFFWHAKQSQIYRTLKALEDAELITSHVEPQDDRPDRRVYTITDTGKADLETWLAEPEQDITQKKDTLLLKLFFAARGSFDPQMLIAQLRLQRKLYVQQLDHLETRSQEALVDKRDRHPEFHTDVLLWEATHRFGMMYSQMYVQWLDEVIQMLENHT